MGKKIYLIILAVIGIGAILVGVGTHIGGISMKLPFFKNATGAGAVVNTEGTLDDFTELEVEADLMNLTILSGKTASYRLESNERLAPSINVKNGKLEVKQNKKESISPSVNGMKCNLTLVIPVDLKLEKAKIDSDMGDIDVGGVEADEVWVSDSMGNIILRDSQIETAHITANLGNVQVFDSQVDQLDAELDMGNAEIALKDADPAEYDFDLEVDLGKITINGEKQKNEYRKDGSGDKEIRIENDLGNIEINM